MISASPTIVQLEIDSAWIVILAVSLVTLPAALVLRRLISRPGGLASGLLLLSPLLLPLVAALLYPHALLPEIAVLRPAAQAFLENPGELGRFLFLSDGRVVTPYALVGSAGPWLFLIGMSVSGVMLVRRLVGSARLRRVVSRARPAPAEHPAAELSRDLAGSAGIAPPQILMLPEGMCGAFAVGGKRPRILVSDDLVEDLDDDELEAVLAHEIAHIQAHDVRLVFVADILRASVAWNPLAHVAFRRLAADRELEADRRAAALTGRPLSLASGLLKVCDLMRRRPMAHAPALGAVRRDGRVARRVTRLLALSDGGSVAGPVGRTPHLIAAGLVAAVGLLAAGRLAAQDPGGIAFVWGAPTSSQAPLWSPYKPATEGVQDRAGSRSLQREKARIYKRYIEPLSGGVVFEERHVPQWVRAMTRLARASGISKEVLQWEVRQGWRATPLVKGPIGIYRMELSPSGRLAQ